MLAHLAAEARRDAEAVRLCEEAIKAAPVPATSRARPALHEALGRAYAGLGQMNRSIEVLRAAFDEAQAEPADPGLAVRFGVLLASAYTDAGLGRRGLPDAGCDQGRSRRPDRPGGSTPGSSGRSRARTPSTARPISPSATHAVSSRRWRAASICSCSAGRTCCLGSILLDRSHRAEADAELDRATEVLERGGAAKPELALLDYERGRSALLDGRLDDAETLARAGLDRTEATEPGTAGMLYTLLAKITLARGDLDEARRLCNEAAGVLTERSRCTTSTTSGRRSPTSRSAPGDLPAALAALRRVTAGGGRTQDLASRPAVRGVDDHPGHARPLVDAPQPVLDPRVAAVEREVLGQDPVEPLVVVVAQPQAVLQEREGGAVGRRELVADTGGRGRRASPRRASATRASRPPAPRPGRDRASRAPAPASIRFGGTFHTRLNQSMNTRISARRAVSAGKSGGSGNRSSRCSMMRLESTAMNPSSSSTGTRSWPLASRIGGGRPASHITTWASTPLWPSARATRSTFVENGMA